LPDGHEHLLLEGEAVICFGWHTLLEDRYS